jgi:hypothetical protein
MTVQTLRLGGRRFVVLPEKEFRLLQRKAQNGTKQRPRRSAADDRADTRRSLRRLHDPNDREVPYEEARKRLGLV